MLALWQLFRTETFRSEALILVLVQVVNPKKIDAKLCHLSLHGIC